MKNKDVRFCIHCGQDKPIEFFSRQGHKCKECKWLYIPTSVDEQELKFHKFIRSLTSQAIREGYLVPAESCCLCIGQEGIQAHHTNYSLADAFNVQWLCDRCHRRAHKQSSL